jgi:hypothetical protein
MTAFIALVGMKGVGEDLEQVLRWVKHPAGNFGRLAQFARGQWSDVIVGHELDGLHGELADEARNLARLTKMLARSVFRVLRTHQQRILDLQLIHQRIAGAVVDLYAMAAVISRLQSMLEHTNGNGRHDPSRDSIVGKSFCHHAAQRISGNLRALFTSSESDKRTLDTADAVIGWTK